jgi:hypothetical protein
VTWRGHAARLRVWYKIIRAVRRQHIETHGGAPRLFIPRRYSEKIQWRKLFDPKPEFTIFSDKLAARAYIVSRGLAANLPELLWQGDNLADLPAGLPVPCILKSSHACGHSIIAREAADLAPEAISARTQHWLKTNWGVFANEPGYLNIPPKFLVEKLLQNADGSQPVEHKVFVFNGRAQAIQVLVGRGETRRNLLYTRNWELLDWECIFPLTEYPMPRPVCLERLLEVAETLTMGCDHLRVDLYDCDDDVVVGELTVYSWSGLNGLRPAHADIAMGAFWQLGFPLFRALHAIFFLHWGRAN